MKEVSKTAIFPLTVLMHYDDIPTTRLQTFKKPIYATVCRLDGVQSDLFQHCDYHVLAQ